jgi:hypothetical protein
MHFGMSNYNYIYKKTLFENLPVVSGTRHWGKGSVLLLYDGLSYPLDGTHERTKVA